MKLTEFLGIEYPIMQGGMANVATGAFAAAVSNAGALGVIGSGGMRYEQLKEEIQYVKAHTDKPFGVNLMMMNPAVEQFAQLVIDEQVPVVTTGAGNPAKYVEAWKAAGIKVIPVVPSAALARRLVNSGVDAVIAEGTEAGGHVGELTTMALVPQVVQAVDVPVIAAGGIASGQQMLAAEALGASGVQVGTILLSSTECPIHDNYKNAIVKAKSNQVTVIGRIGGIPVRVLKNQMSQEYIEQEKTGADKMELEHFTLGALRRAVREGDVERGSLMAGQVVGQIDCIRSLREIFEKMMREYEQTKEALR